MTSSLFSTSYLTDLEVFGVEVGISWWMQISVVRFSNSPLSLRLLKKRYMREYVPLEVDITKNC